MLNLLNPLNWVTSAQDWLVKVEKSSGFRPYFIFMMLAMGVGVLLIFSSPLFGSKAINIILYVGIFCIIIPIFVFPFIYIIKAFTQPDFCRSETHVERKMRYEIEMLGTESKQIKAEVVDKAPYYEIINEPQNGDIENQLEHEDDE